MGHGVLVFPDDCFDDCGDIEIFFRFDRAESGVCRYEYRTAVAVAQIFHRPRAVDFGDDDVAVGGLKAAFYEHHIPGHDARVNHGFAADFEHESCLFIGDEPLIQTQRVGQFFFGGRRKSRLHGAQEACMAERIDNRKAALEVARQNTRGDEPRDAFGDGVGRAVPEQFHHFTPGGHAVFCPEEIGYPARRGIGTHVSSVGVQLYTVNVDNKTPIRYDAPMRPPLVVKKSPIVIIRNFVALQFASVGVYILAASLKDYGAIWESQSLVQNIPFPVAQVLFILLTEAVMTMYIFLSWYRQTVRLTDDQLVFDEGLLLRTHTVVPLDRVATTTYRQNILGRLTHYGTLDVRDGRGALLLHLVGMSDPREFVDAMMERKRHLRSDVEVEPSELIRSEEHEHVERKSTLRWDLKTNAVNKSLEKAALKTVAAFMNSQGGHLLLGVGDRGDAVGLERDIATLARRDGDGLENHFSNLLSSMLGPSFRQFVRLRPFTHDGKACMLVAVSAADRPAYLRDQDDEEFFIRTGNSTRSLRMSEANSYISSRFGTNQSSS